MFLFKLVVISMLVGAIAFADDVPTIHQIYQTAESGDLNGAHQMAEQVLKDHPESAKAHFVDAEILVRQGNLSEAKNELEKAEKLAPGLPFAKSQAVQSLKQHLYNPSNITISNGVRTPHPMNQPFPWMMVIMGIGAVLLIWLAFRAFSTRRTNAYPAQYNGNSTTGGYTNQNAPYNSSPGFGGAQPYPQQSGGLGSSIMSGLATGAAAGVGIVAGEAMMHHFMGDSTTNAHENMNNQSFVNNGPSSDMGGNNFGIEDNSSWDDNSSDDMSDSSDDTW
ncbi:MAG: tetratricopeptide repeat protein [Campylobacterales bacterium]|nr:tetratricopeptide repeat protein [Campylobacterales bacterium]